MQIEILHYRDLNGTTEAAVVIDVIRAFTVAAYAFAGGAERILMVRGVDDALCLHDSLPGSLLAGEVGGRLIPGFDLNNSPSAVQRRTVAGRIIIQRTGAGTQGAVAASGAGHLVVASLVNAAATAAYIRRLGLSSVTLVPTALPDIDNAIEDLVCARYLEALLLRPEEARDVLETGLRRLEETGRYAGFGDDSDFPADDVEAVLAVDKFNVAMVGKPLDGFPFPVIDVRAIPL